MKTILLSGGVKPIFSSCINCNTELQNRLYDSIFYPNLLVMLSAFIVLALIVWSMGSLSIKRYNVTLPHEANRTWLNPVPLSTIAMVLGIGIGGFLDGILFHQILQWHGMLTNKIPATNLIDKSVNMVWDGVFHLFTLCIVMTGIILLWKLYKRNDVNTSGNLLSGGIIAGWGLFNIVEGIINHHLIKLHNVREATIDPDIWNYGFLLSSLIILVVGLYIIKKHKPERLQQYNS